MSNNANQPLPELNYNQVEFLQSLLGLLNLIDAVAGSNSSLPADINGLQSLKQLVLGQITGIEQQARSQKSRPAPRKAIGFQATLP